jgi:hypothetical protein
MPPLTGRLPSSSLTHNALDAAKEQADIFAQMLAETDNKSVA